jgi:hypothetical protein
VSREAPGSAKNALCDEHISERVHVLSVHCSTEGSRVKVTGDASVGQRSRDSHSDPLVVNRDRGHGLSREAVAVEEELSAEINF